MASAYAAVVTLMDTIKQIQLHPRPPISLDESQVRSLTQNLIFLQEFLEGYSHLRNTNELLDALVRSITYAVHATEDTIESHVIKQIFGGFTIEGQNEFQICLQKLVDDMDIIKGEVMEIKETISPIQAPLHTRVRSSSSSGQNVMVGFDDALYQLMDKLTGHEQSRQIIPIVGMGGIGKTTLARNVYSKLSSSHHFDVCAWTTISHSYNIQEIFIDVLSQVRKIDKEKLREKSEGDLRDELHQCLYGRRYLIIMDDIWSVEVWNEIQLYLPDCENGSRVVATTRLSRFASQVNDAYSYFLKMKFLDDEQSWNLFCKIVFGEEVCPRDFEDTGKKIAKGCKGLPLSISVIGGLLAKSKYELEYWSYVAAHLSSVVNLENEGECSKILDMSYSQLPIHLKPCFLHLGVFGEDEKIRVSRLIELWVAEGFLKPICGKSMEVVATEYFNELIDRHLILVRELGAAGNIKYCSIHDLLRDFCLREAKNEMFYSVLTLENLSIPPSSNRRVVIPEWWIAKRYYAAALPYSTQAARSLYYSSGKSPPLLNFKFLRIWKKYYTSHFTVDATSMENMFHLVHLRYLEFEADTNFRPSFFNNRFWNLSTISMARHGEAHGESVWDVSHIWKMPQLKHVRFGMCVLYDPTSHDHDDGGNDIILENLQTLSTMRNFKCSEEFIMRIPNLKKLVAQFTLLFPGGTDSYSLLHNIQRLCKLESFEVHFIRMESGLARNLTFPNSLKKLTIGWFDAEDVLEKIGSLPHLVKLKLLKGFFHTREWVTVEGQFGNLRFLHLDECIQLKLWKTDSSHFPRLERLSLRHIRHLNEIPTEIGDIQTLHSIDMTYCSDSIVSSARKIKEEQEENGNESIQLHVHGTLII